jgi:methyl-accepting chemotaxis protein
MMWYLSGRLFDEAQVIDAELPSLSLLNMTQFVFVVVTGVVVMLSAFQYSHRVIGPALRLTAALKRIRTGDLSVRVRLRRSDELSQIAEELNRLVEHLECRAGPPSSVSVDRGSDVADVPPLFAAVEAARSTERGGDDVD